MQYTHYTLVSLVLRNVNQCSIYRTLKCSPQFAELANTVGALFNARLKLRQQNEWQDQPSQPCTSDTDRNKVYSRFLL